MSLRNVYATCRTLPPIEFPHVVRAARDRSDPELGEHLNGFMGFVMGGGKREMNATRFAVLGHLERVQHHVALEVEPAHGAAFRAWAARANALVLTGSGFVRDPDGRVLVDPETGDAEAGAEVPYLDDALARRERTTRLLRKRGIALPKSLPPVISEYEVSLRPAKEVDARCFALLACAVRAEGVSEGEGLSPNEILEKLERAKNAFSPLERAFFFEDAPPRQRVVDFLWRYESLWVLAWSIGLVEDLPDPNDICDVPKIAAAVLAQDTHRAERPSKLRSKATILDALDLHYRLHWAVRDARLAGREPPAGLEAGVVFERRYALEWLTRAKDAAWDGVDTAT